MYNFKSFLLQKTLQAKVTKNVFLQKNVKKEKNKQATTGYNATYL